MLAFLAEERARGVGSFVFVPHGVGDTLGRKLATIVVDSRLLLREALESLLRTHSHSVISGARFATEIAAEPDVHEGAELVILGAQSAHTAFTEAASVRKLWRDAKIVLLLEPGSSVDLRKLLESEVDACVSLFVSAATLMRTLDLIAVTDARILIVGDMNDRPLTSDHEAYQPGIETESKPRQPDDSEATLPAMATMTDAQPTGQDARVSQLDDGKKATPLMAPLRILPELSERELQILNGLVQGHANKIIARTCDITEATVKVHLRSILRKIRAGNRTQAAIWALESGYSFDVPRGSH
jgi:two-component system nitrate/nitrite response regulator NarL